MNAERKNWDDKEVQFVKNHYQKFSVLELAKKLGRSKISIKHKLAKLNIKLAALPRNDRPWNKKEIEIIKRFGSKQTGKQLSKKINRTPAAIMLKRILLGIKHPHPLKGFKRSKAFKEKHKKYWANPKNKAFMKKARQEYDRPTKQELIKLYWKEKKSMSQISKKYGCGNEITILHWMNDYNIPRRTLSEAINLFDQKIFDKRGKGVKKAWKNMPKWKKELRNKKVSKSKLKYKFTKQHKANVGKAQTVRFERDGGYWAGKKRHMTKEHLENIRLGNNVFPNKPEKKIGTLLDKLCPQEYKYTGDGKSGSFFGKFPDFINVNGKKKIIECFGTHWHDEFLFPDRSEAKRKRHFAKFGFKTLIIWEDELKNEAKVIDKIIHFQGMK